MIECKFYGGPWDGQCVTVNAEPRLYAPYSGQLGDPTRNHPRPDDPIAYHRHTLIQNGEHRYIYLTEPVEQLLKTFGVSI